ncbi:hypothetical protein BU17DRAFT_68398 [Hysterangium stoloniferum]|nr:hypothetical protein BU17DRAFT_68398 [Hysterangium stoloniferum]
MAAGLRGRVSTLELCIAQHDQTKLKLAADNYKLTRQVASLRLAADEERASHKRSIDSLWLTTGELQSQVTDLELSKKQDKLPSMALALIDGDGNLFRSDFVKRGVKGGIEAAKLLSDTLVSYCRQEEPWEDGSPVHLWIHIFLNSRGLRNAFCQRDICTASEFDKFVIGLSQANPRLTITDVHPGKDAADIKIKEYLSFYVQFSQTLKVFFGGLLDKVVLLKGYRSMAKGIRCLALPTLEIGELFMSERLSTFQRIRTEPLEECPVPLRRLILSDICSINVKGYHDNSTHLSPATTFILHAVWTTLQDDFQKSTRLSGKRRSLNLATGQRVIYHANLDENALWLMHAHLAQIVLANAVDVRFKEPICIP